MKKNKPFTAIDLFSGCGGLTAGLKQAGYAVIGAVEIDQKARETYTINHPETPLIGRDIRLLTSNQITEFLEIEPGSLDLLAGCPPCQGFSTLRNKNSSTPAKDSRNDLIEDFERLTVELRPKLVMMENVAGLSTFSKFKAFVRNLELNGYSVKYDVLDVSRYGVPQRRKRLILSASRVGEAVLAIPDELPKVTVREAIGRLPEAGASGDLLHDLPSPRRSERIQSLIKAIPKNGGSRHDLPESFQLKCHKHTSGFNDVYGRMRWDEVSPTITSGCINPSKGRFIHPDHDRPITLREAAILQGFPHDYKFDVRHGKESIGLMIGNALPPTFICAHSKKMAEALQK